MKNKFLAWLSIWVLVVPSLAQAQPVIQGTAADGSTALGNPVQVGGKDGSNNAQALTLDGDGHVQVDVLSGGTSGTQFDEDEQHTSTDTGTMALGVRRDADTTLAGTDGDYVPFQVDADGKMKVEVFNGGDLFTVVGTAADGAAASGNPVQMGGVDGASNAQAITTDTDGHLQVDVLSGSTAGTEFNEDSAHTSTDAGGMTLAVRRDADTTLVNLDGDYAPLQVDATGKLKVEMFDGGDTLTMAGTAADGAAASGNPLQMGGVDGSSNAQALLTDTDGHLQIDVLSGGGAGSQFAEDSPHTSTDTGTEMLAVRRDADTSLVNLDGDYAPLQVDAAGKLKVEMFDGGDSHTIDNATLAVTGSGVEASALRVTVASDSTGVLSVDDNAGALSVDDNAGSLTVDNAALSVTGSGVEATALRVSVANDSTGVLSVDDNSTTLSVDDGAGTLTVDNSTLAVVGAGTEAAAMRVTVANDSTGVLSVDDNSTTLSVDDGAGTLTVDNAALSETGGGTEAAALRVTVANNSTGVLSVDDNSTTLSVDDGAGALSVDDNSGSLTVDNAALSVTGSGVEATALRVTVATDSTGVLSVDDGASTLSVDDNSGSLTVDNAALAVTGGGVQASALRVTMASDSTGVLSVDDNAGALTVDQATHDNLQANANLQVANSDVASNNPVPVAGTASDGAAASGSPVQVGGKDGSGNAQTLTTDTDGHLQVDVLNGVVTIEETNDSEGAAADATVANAAANLRLLGWSVRESAGSPAQATAILRNAADTDTGTGGVQCNESGGAVQVGGAVIHYIELAGDQSVSFWMGDRGIAVTDGICVDVLAGTVDVQVHTIAE